MFGRYIIFVRYIKTHISELRKKTFSGANLWNIARMHNSTDYVKFLEKSYAPFLKKVAKT